MLGRIKQLAVNHDCVRWHDLDHRVLLSRQRLQMDILTMIADLREVDDQPHRPCLSGKGCLLAQRFFHEGRYPVRLKFHKYLLTHQIIAPILGMLLSVGVWKILQEK